MIFPPHFLTLEASMAAGRVDLVAAVYKVVTGAPKLSADSVRCSEVSFEPRTLFLLRFHCRSRHQRQK
jgi:hypothetical protein